MSVEDATAGLQEAERNYLKESIGDALTDALIVVAKERYLRTDLSATSKETALRMMAAHLRAHNPERSEIYRAKKQEEYDLLVRACTSMRSRLAALCARRGDLSQGWKADDEKEYLRLCKKFDTINKSK